MTDKNLDEIESGFVEAVSVLAAFASENPKSLECWVKIWVLFLTEAECLVTNIMNFWGPGPVLNHATKQVCCYVVNVHETVSDAMKGPFVECLEYCSVGFKNILNVERARRIIAKFPFYVDKFSKVEVEDTIVKEYMTIVDAREADTLDFSEEVHCDDVTDAVVLDYLSVLNDRVCLKQGAKKSKKSKTKEKKQKRR